MAGSNQAANLGGMLSQIGGSLSKAPDISGLVRNVENMGRPDVDPNSPASLEALAQWQQKMGRTDEARLTQIQLNAVEARRKEEEAKKTAQKRAGAAAQYQQIVSDPNATPEQIVKARNEAMAVGESLGVDMLEQLNRIDTNAIQKQHAAWAQEDRSAEAAETAQSKRISALMTNAKTTDDIQKVIEETPEEFKGLATKIGSAVQTFRAQQEASRVREAENVGDVDLTRDYSQAGDATSNYNTRLERAQELKKKMMPNGTWLPGGRKQVVDMLAAIDRDYSNLIINNAANAEAERNRVERQFRTDLRMANKPTKPQLEAAKAQLTEEKSDTGLAGTSFFADKPTELEILERAIQMNEDAVYTRYGRKKDGKEAPAEKAGESAGNPVMVESLTDAKNLAPGTYFKGPDGKLRVR